MEKAMSYEYLIRAVFKCGRTNKHGANADIFRALERVSIPISGNTKIDNVKLNRLLGEVTAHISTALYEAKDLYAKNNDFCAKIDRCFEFLNSQSIQNIDKCIDEAWVAFHEVGLYV